MELWDLYDRNRIPLGKNHVRGEKMKFGEYHLVVDVVSVNQDNKILITKRHPEKNYGGLWETTRWFCNCRRNFNKCRRKRTF